jgi:hypothetical protein
MTLSLKHTFTSAIPDGADSSSVRPSNWNAEHTLIGTANTLMGFSGAGVGAEVTVGTGLTLSSGTLSSAGVNSFSAGTTGFTPNSATTGTVTLGGSLVAASGGTGQTVYAIGDLLYADTTTSLAKLADVATGSVLVSGGVGVAPAWSNGPSLTTLTITTSITTPLIKMAANTAQANFVCYSAAAIGGSQTNAAFLYAAATTSQMRTSVGGNVTSTVLAANTVYANLLVAGGASGATEATSGVHPVLSNLTVLGPTFVNGTATTTDAATVYIDGPPAGTAVITNPVSALWVGSGRARFDGGVVTTATTVAALPASPVTGQRGFVNDALAPVFGSAVTAGGAVNVPVYYTGAAWFVG